MSEDPYEARLLVAIAEAKNAAAYDVLSAYLDADDEIKAKAQEIMDDDTISADETGRCLGTLLLGQEH